MKRIVLLLAALLLCGCRGEAEAGDPGLALTVAISPTPPAVGTARLILTLSDTSGAPLEGALVVVEGNMSHAGMLAVVDTAVAEGPGAYGIPDFRFTMAGDWILDVQATLPDGRWVGTRYPASVVGPMGGGR